jgi:N-methylhydantoinase B
LNIVLDRITSEVIFYKLEGITNEMLNSIYRTGYSTIIRESKDAGAAILDSNGRLMAQSSFHGFPLTFFKDTLELIYSQYDRGEINDGDVFITNDPYVGGSFHLPDIHVFTPVFHNGKLAMFCCNFAHKPDIGGMAPGSSSPNARDIFQEGIQIPPVKLFQKGVLNSEIERLVAKNSRIPDVIKGDIRGQVGSANIGKLKLVELVKKYGLDATFEAFEEILERDEKTLRSEISRISDGISEASGYLDDDGAEIGIPKKIHVDFKKEGSEVFFDFSGSDDQSKGPYNTKPALVRAACYLAVMSMLSPTARSNEAISRIVHVKTRPGSILSPIFPSPVSTYMKPTSMCFYLSFSVISKLTPGRAIACNGMTTTSTISGIEPKRKKRYVFYEIKGAAMGARNDRDGVSGIIPDFFNIMLPSVEIIESEFPIRVTRFEMLKDSGGAGKYRGGLGFIREYEMLEEATMVLRAEMYTHEPWGLDGGKSGSHGYCTLNPSTPSEQKLHSRVGNLSLHSGDVIRFETPGSGGYGNPTDRDSKAVLDDVENGYVSPEAAEKEYGLKPKR